MSVTCTANLPTERANNGKLGMFSVLEMPTSASQLLHQNVHLDISRDPPCVYFQMRWFCPSSLVQHKVKKFQRPWLYELANLLLNIASRSVGSTDMYKNSVVNWGHPESTIFCKQSAFSKVVYGHLHGMQHQSKLQWRIRWFQLSKQKNMGAYAFCK
jgi:hypothetical protein